MRLLSWLKRLLRSGREPELLPPPKAEVVAAAETLPAPSSSEFKPYAPIASAGEIVPAAAIETSASETSTVEIPPAVPSLETSTVTALTDGHSEVSASAALPAKIPRVLPSPAYSDELMRTRALYFTPAAFSAPSVERVLAPDLLFRLAPDPRRALAGASAVTTGPAPPVVFHEPAQAKPQLRLMDDFSTSTETEPRSDSSGSVLNVDPLLLTLFFRDRESGPSVPPETTAEYLSNPALLAHAVELRDRMVQHWSAGGAPLAPRQVYALAREISPHAGTALLLCHDTTKAFARGSEAIVWRILNRARGEYSDDEATHIAAVLHRNGVLKATPFANPSILYLLFSASEFGTADPGDFPRFFASASAAWFAASRETRLPAAPPSDAARQIALCLVELSRQMAGQSVDLTPAHRGWLWANALNFAEFAAFSRSQFAARNGAIVALRGACFGLREADQPLDPAWKWHVPRIGASIHAPFDLTRATAELLSAQTICT